MMEKLFYHIKDGEFEKALSFVRDRCGKSPVHGVTKTRDIMEMAKEFSRRFDVSKLKDQLVKFWKYSTENEKEIVFAMRSNREARLLVIGILKELLTSGEEDTVLEILDEIADWIYDWETCDQIAMKVLSPLSKTNPDIFQKFDAWIKRKNPWTKRLPIATVPFVIKSSPDLLEKFSVYLKKASECQEIPVKKAYKWATREIEKLGRIDD